MTFDPARGRGDGYSVPHTSGKVLTVLALVAVLAVGCIVLMNDSDSSEAASETSGSCGADLAWSYDSSTGALTVTGSGSMTDFSFSDTRWGGNDIKSVSLPDGLTSIGEVAFYGCTSLSSVTIPDSVTSIGYYAFYGCTSLSSVTIPDSVTSIGYYAFSGCTSLTSVTIPDSVTSIGGVAFEGCTSLTSVNIGKGVTSIADDAFKGCTSISTISLDSDVILNNRVFARLTSLTSVTLGNNITSIGSGAFGGCASLTSITLPDSVTSIGSTAFEGCTSLSSVTLSESVTSIGSSAFRGCASLTSITLPDSVTSIGDYAFSGCTSLRSILVSDNSATLHSIDGILYDKSGKTLLCCPGSLTSFSITSDVESISTGAFSGNIEVVKFVDIPSITLSTGAFIDCTNLKNIVLEDNTSAKFGKYSIAYTTPNEHTLRFVASNGFTLPNDATYGNVKVVYEDPSEGKPSDDIFSNPIMYVAIGIIAALIIAGGVIVIKKRQV